MTGKRFGSVLKRGGAGLLALAFVLLTVLPVAGSHASSSPADAAARELADLDGAYRSTGSGDTTAMRQLSLRARHLLAAPKLPARYAALTQLMLAMIERDRVLADDPTARGPGLAAARAYLNLSQSADENTAAEAWLIHGVILTHPLALASQQDVQEAVSDFSMAVRLSSGDPTIRRSAMFNHAAASVFISGAGAAAAIEGAIRDFETLLGDPSFAADVESSALARLNLAGAYRQRQAGDRTANAERAIALYQQALAPTDQRRDPAGWARVARNLADALLQSRLLQPGRIDRAVALLEGSVTAFEKANRLGAAFDTRLFLADALRERATWTSASDLDAAAAILDAAHPLEADRRRLGQLAGARADLLATRRKLGDAKIRPEDVAAAWRAALDLTDRARWPRAGGRLWRTTWATHATRRTAPIWIAALAKPTGRLSRCGPG